MKIQTIEIISIYAALGLYGACTAFNQPHYGDCRNTRIPICTVAAAITRQSSCLSLEKSSLVLFQAEDAGTLLRTIDENNKKHTPTKLNGFYREHFGGQPPPAIKPKDVQFSLLMTNHGKDDSLLSTATATTAESTMVATLRISPRQQGWDFLRGLCVAKHLRHEGLALQLLKQTLHYLKQRMMLAEDYEYCVGVYCLADFRLAPLYEKAGFVQYDNTNNNSNNADDDDDDSIPLAFMRIQLDSMLLKNPDLRLFKKLLDLREQQPTLDMDNTIRDKNHAKNDEEKDKESAEENTHNNINTITKVLLLQHLFELRRKTATAPLLLEDISTSSSLPPLSPCLNISNLTWSGRADNERVQEWINNHVSNPTLLWTGGKPLNINNTSNDTTPSTSTYIVLDGTWQEARTMFRKIPLLQTLPRITLDTSVSSSSKDGEQQQQSKSVYRLRQDYTGWKEKFKGTATSGDGSSSSELLCTAEVIGELERSLGHEHNYHLIHERLDRFQKSFPGYKQIETKTGPQTTTHTRR